MKKVTIGFLILGVFVSGCAQPEKRELSGGNAKLQEIEKKLEVLTPDFARLMPEYSERFHVLHFAGEAEDWATAKHELHEIEGLREIGEVVDPQKGLCSGRLKMPI